MDLAIKLVPGYVFQRDELITVDKLNAAANPTIQLTGGDVGTLLLQDNSVTISKLADGCLSADPTGWAKMQDGYVINSKLANAAVDSTKLAAGAVTQTKLANGAVTSAAIGD